MKTLITLTMVLFTTVTMAQNGTWGNAAVPKKANKIAVLLRDSTLESYRLKVVLQMDLNGYSVLKNDVSGFNIISKPKQLNITEITINVIGTKTDSGYFVVFTPKGEIKTKSEITSGPLEVNNSTIKGSLSQISWNDLELLCKSFNGKIFYYNRK